MVTNDLLPPLKSEQIKQNPLIYLTPQYSTTCARAIKSNSKYIFILSGKHVCFGSSWHCIVLLESGQPKFPLLMNKHTDYPNIYFWQTVQSTFYGIFWCCNVMDILSVLVNWKAFSLLKQGCSILLSNFVTKTSILKSIHQVLSNDRYIKHRNPLTSTANCQTPSESQSIVIRVWNSVSLFTTNLNVSGFHTVFCVRIPQQPQLHGTSLHWTHISGIDCSRNPDFPTVVWHFWQNSLLSLITLCCVQV